MRVKGAALTLSAIALLVAASATSDAPVQFGDPVPGLTASQLQAFQDGKEEFEAAEDADEGLGPVFIVRTRAH